MSRKELDEATLNAINSKLPDLTKVEGFVLPLDPNMITSGLRRFDSTIPSAVACLKDALDISREARYALREVFAHQIDYLNRTDPNEPASIFFSRFYITDAALRIYSAAEHLAAAIVMMLEITDMQRPSESERRTSHAMQVGKYLAVNKPGCVITSAISELASLDQWKKTMKYRNAWVHEQPPTIKGLGTTYKRGERPLIEPEPKVPGRQVHRLFGGGDAADHKIDEVVEFVRIAFYRFVAVFEVVVGYYVSLLEANGISFTNTNTKDTMTLKI